MTYLEGKKEPAESQKFRKEILLFNPAPHRQKKKGTPEGALVIVYEIRLADRRCAGSTQRASATTGVDVALHDFARGAEVGVRGLARAAVSTYELAL